MKSSDKKPLRLALGHQARVGKDTFAEHVGSIMEVQQLTFATDLKTIATNVQTTLNKPIEKDPLLLQKLGTLFREHYGDDVFTKTVVRRILDAEHANPDINIIITDMREPVEKRTLEAMGFQTVKITRADRPIDRNPNHSSEIALADATFDYIIDNDGTIEEFRKNIDVLISNI